jgi:hypothetical protein
MSECAEGLGPDNAKVASTPIVDLSEAPIVAIGNVAEEERNRYLRDEVSHLFIAT